MKINDNSGYYKALAAIEVYIEKGFSELSQEETDNLKELSLAVEAFERNKFPMPVSTTLPSLLEEFMHENRMNKGELSKLLEVPNSTISELMNGKKKMNLNIARKLHDKLKIDGNFLLNVKG